MTTLNDLKIARRDLLKGCGALVVSMHLPAAAVFGSREAQAAGKLSRTLNPAELDTWLAVSETGDVTAYWGKMDMGQGVDTAISQIVAEELDIPVDRVTVIFGDTALCANQGGASGSTGISNSGVAFRHAAAEARLVLLEKAADELNTPVARLTVSDGVIHAKGNPSVSISYRQLIGNRLFDAPIEWNGSYGNSLGLKTRATPKEPQDYKVVGTSVRRKDIAGKIIPSTEFAAHVNVPGMLHGRMVRPKVAGAHIGSVDKDSVSHIPGVQVVVEKDFVGVVAPKEWDAIKAARELKVEWDESDAGFPTTSEELHDWIRQARPVASDVPLNEGDVDQAIEASERIIEAEYEWPFQSHARMGPALGVADIRHDHATVWTDSQKFYDTAYGIAKLFELDDAEGRPRPPSNKVRGIWKPGPGSYGRSDAGDGAMDAAVLSRAVGAPVRMQWMRDEGHAWDPKGPAAVIRARAGIDRDGNITAYHYHLKGFSRKEVESRENDPAHVLAGHLLGHSIKPAWDLQRPAESYNFRHKRYSWDAVPPLRRQASPLRAAHLRDPYGAEVHFGAEQFIDEMAAAVGADPVEFRLRHVSDPRDKAVIEAAAELAGWQSRPSPNPDRGSGNILTGRGIAYAQRNGSVNAVVAEVEVNRKTGRVWIKNFYVGSDHGQIINPFTLQRTIEGNLIMASSRTLFEEVKFDRQMVRAMDWASYPILEAPDAPLDIKIKLIDRPELGPYGAGEPTTRVAPGAIANAFFDATGVRLRKAPLSPERVKAALQAG